MTITPRRNSYAMRTEFAVTTTAGTRTGYPTVEAAEEAGRLMEAGVLAPECPVCGWAGEKRGPKADAHRVWHTLEQGGRGMRIVKLVPVGRAAR